MIKKFVPVLAVVALAGSLAGCYVEDEREPAGGGGGTVIERNNERVIERDRQPDNVENNYNMQNPPADTDHDIRIEDERENENNRNQTP